MKKFNLNDDFNSVKLIIWDLDNTIWDGVLSEGEVKLKPFVTELLEKLTNFGIVNSICSKNDNDEAIKKMTDLGISHFFVFNSINWQNKGQRIKRTISQMNLKEKNALFIDDEASNLEEASFYCSEIYVSSPDILPDLLKFVPISNTPSDRLAEYRILEKKRSDEENFESPTDFLKQSDIKVFISKNCWKERKRIYEIIYRTNQLNFTKNRLSENEIYSQLRDKDIDCGLVKCRDKYGYYGIIGFYAIKDHRLLHFSFSCRCLGMQIEQFVYSLLGFPQITVVGDTAVKLSNSLTPDWVELVNYDLSDSSIKDSTKAVKTIFKGPCDIEQIFSFIRDNKNFSKEFNYVSRTKKCTIYQGTHSITVAQVAEKNPYIEEIKKLPFYDDDAFKTKLFNQKNGLIFISLIPEGCYAIYQHKNNNYKIVLGEWCDNICDFETAKLFNSGKLFNGGFRFSEEEYNLFRNKFVYEGRITPKQVCDNYDLILRHIDSSNDIYFLLPSELAVPTTQIPYKNREEYHKKLNDLFVSRFSSFKNVFFINLTDFANDLSCYTNNVNHFHKRVYFELSKHISVIFEKKGSSIKETNALERIFRKVIKKIKHE